MKLFKKIRKGFTLIELVVVIAVIAILSAVAVVSYISITNKAKQSSDEQAVRQMNTALKASSILGASDIVELYNVLAEEGMDAKNYKPLAKDTFFFWDQGDNVIVYAKFDSKTNSYVGIYPESYKGVSKGDRNWISLSKEIKTVSVEKQSSGEYEVSSGEELYTILADAKNYEPSSIELKGNVDLMGADVSFENVTELNGGTSGAELKNLNQLKPHSYYKDQEEDKTAGLFHTISKDTLIENVTLKNCVVGSSTVGSVGLICGVLSGPKVDSKLPTLTLRNVDIDHCKVYCAQKGGTLVGYLDDGNVVVEDTCSITNVDIYSVQAECGKLFGSVGDDGSSTKNLDEITFNGTYDNVNLHMLENNLTKKVDSWIDDDKMVIKVVNTDTYKFALTEGTLVCGGNDYQKSSKRDGVAGVYNYFRHFHANSLFTICSNSKIKYQGSTYQALNANKKALTGGEANEATNGALPFIEAMAETTGWTKIA